MAGFSDFLELELLDHVFGAAAYVAPVTLYPALFTVAPTDAGGGTEVAGGSYARPAVTNNATNFPAAAAGAKSNGTAITWPTATADWGTVVAIGLYDAVTGGNLLGWCLVTNQSVPNGVTYSIPVGELDITLD
jgi:hypothetical protein